MDPPHDPLNPWEIARKQKKQKTSYIGGFFKKKDETDYSVYCECGVIRMHLDVAGDLFSSRLGSRCCSCDVFGDLGPIQTVLRPNPAHSGPIEAIWRENESARRECSGGI